MESSDGDSGGCGGLKVFISGTKVCLFLQSLLSFKDLHLHFPEIFEIEIEFLEELSGRPRKRSLPLSPLVNICNDIFG